MIEEAVRNSGCGKRCGEIQVKTSVHLIFLSQSCATLRILHEHHGARGGNHTMPDAFENPVSCLCVVSPIVSIDDEDAASRRRSALTACYLSRTGIGGSAQVTGDVLGRKHDRP
jgi:hypothetical protein